MRGGSVDYLVFGTGMGATLVFVGLAGRTIGPALRYRTPSRSADVLRAEQLVARFAWARFCSSLGASLALAGAFLLVVTGILVVIHVEDGVGTASILVALAVVILLMAFWSWAFVQRFGLVGIMTPRPHHDPMSDTEDPLDDSADHPDVSVPVGATAPTNASPANPVADPGRTRPSPVPAATTTATPHPTADIPATSTTTTEAPRRTTQPPPLMRRDPAIVTVSERPTPTTTPLPPMVTHADPSRSEIVNSSDAAALDRILALGDDPDAPSSLLDDVTPAAGDAAADDSGDADPSTTPAGKPPNG